MSDLLPCPFCGDTESLTPEYRALPKPHPGAVAYLPEGAGVRVKPLDWQDYPEESFCEPYQIEVRGAFWRAYFISGYESADPILTPAGDRDHPTLEAAKAAAQAHHDARVMAALEPMEPKDE